jgi:hypothetical protein
MVRPRLLGSFQLLQQLFFFFSQYHFVPRSIGTRQTARRRQVSMALSKLR